MNPRLSRFSPSPLAHLTLLMATLLGLGACSPPPAEGWSGYVEGEFVYVGAPVAGTLTHLAVQRGETVAAAAPLFQLDDVSARAARAEADARQKAAEAEAANSAKGRRADEIAVTQAQLTQARAQAERARTELLRNQALVAQSFISRSRLDDAQTAVDQADAHVAELEAALRVAHLPARSDELAAARATAHAAVEVRAQQRWREEQAAQAAPAAGLVADTFFREGEYVPAGQPVLALLPPERRKARFFVPEADLGRLSFGQAVTLRCDGCGSPIPARISYIAPQAEYTPPVIYSNSQKARLVFMVEALPQAGDALRLHPGQPIEVRPGSGS